MPLLPTSPLAVVGLAVVFAGLAIIVWRKDTPKAYGLGLLAMIVFALDVFAGIAGGPGVGYALGFRAGDFLAGASWWSPVTSIFVHADLLHLVFNLFVLLTAGPALEDRIGARKFLVIFFIAAFAALAAQVGLAYTTNVTSPAATAVGASGGIFGVLTAFATRYPRERLPLLLGFFVMWLPAFVVLLVALVLNLALAFTGPSSVAWWGHFAGFLVGLVFTRGLPAPRHAPPGQPSRGSGRLPDPALLEPLATTRDLSRILDRIRQFSPESHTADDPEYVDAWLDRFFETAMCPTCGSPITREGWDARCLRGDWSLHFERK